MSAISLKSITGITSITTPAGVDDQLTLHNNNTTEAVKLDIAGNLHFHNHLNITGVSTASNFKTGTSNLHNTGLNVQDLDVDGHTNLDNVSVAGVTTMSGNLTISNTDPRIIFVDTNNNPDFTLHANDGVMQVENSGSGTQVKLESSGSTRLFGNVIANKDLDVDGHTNLDNVSIAGFTTFSQNINVLGSMTGQSVVLNAGSPTIFLNDTDTNSDFSIQCNGGLLKFMDTTNSYAVRLSINSSGNVSIANDLDVDGHTNLDNVSIAGVVTATQFNSVNGSNTGFFKDNQLTFSPTGDAYIDHRTNNRDIFFRLSRSSALDTNMMQFDSDGEIIKFHKVISVGLQGGGDTATLGGGSGVGAQLTLKYADGTFNTRLLGNGDSYLNVNHGNLGIGTQSPQRKLHVIGTTRPAEFGSYNAVSTVKLYNSATGRGAFNGFDFTANSTSGGMINFYGGSIDLRTSASNGSDATSRLLIAANGEVVISPQNGGASNNRTSIHFNNSAHTPFIAFKTNNLTEAAYIRVPETNGGAELNIRTKNTSGTLLSRLTVKNNGEIVTHQLAGNEKGYPLVMGTGTVANNTQMSGSFNYHDFMCASTGGGNNYQIGGWVFLGNDYGPNPYPARRFQIAKPGGFTNGTLVYQVWHNGDSNYLHGGLWEIRINCWTGSSRFESVAIRCVNGSRDDMRVVAYNDSKGIMIQPSSIWGQVFIRKAGWDDGGRNPGSSYCAVANNGALAIYNSQGTDDGSMPSGGVNLYPFDGTSGSAGATHTGGYYIENGSYFDG